MVFQSTYRLPLCKDEVILYVEVPTLESNLISNLYILAKDLDVITIMPQKML
jgi:hypothetical protein